MLFVETNRDTSPGDAKLPDKIVYELWYNDTVTGNWLATAGGDAVYNNLRISSWTSRLQRSVDEAILAVRAANATLGRTAADVELSVDWRLYPEVEPESGDPSIVLGLLPLFLYCAIMGSFIVILNQVVYEKEQHLLAAMRTMGLFDSAFWLSHVLQQLILGAIASILLYITGLACQMHFFKLTDMSVLLVVFYTYYIATACLAFLFASFISRTKVANGVAFLLFVVGFLFQVFNQVASFSYLWFDPNLFSSHASNALMLYPPIPFAKLFADINFVTKPSVRWDYDSRTQRVVDGTRYTWTTLIDGGLYTQQNVTSLSGKGLYHPPPSSTALQWMALSAAIFIGAAWYLGQVITFDTKAAWPWFPLLPSYWGCHCRQSTPSHVPRDGVCIDKLTKRFGRLKAVDGLSVSMERGRIFALLGHNGAGKTTAVKTLTGQLSASSGNCYVNGIESSRAAQSGMLGGALGLFSRLCVSAVLALTR